MGKFELYSSRLSMMMRSVELAHDVSGFKLGTEQNKINK